MRYPDEDVDFTLIIPSRGRVERLQNLLNTFTAQTHDMSRVEVFVALDFGDDIKKYVDMLEAFDIKKKIFVRNHSDNLNHSYYNVMARCANGKYIWAINDDCELSGMHWDVSIREKVKASGLEGKMMYFKIGGTGVGDNPGSFSSFPMISYEVIERIGYFHHPSIYAWDADEVLWNIFNGLLQKYSVNRIIKAFEIGVRHLNLENPRTMKEGCGIDEAQNNMIKSHKIGQQKMGHDGKDFPHYHQCLEQMLYEVKNGF